MVNLSDFGVTREDLPDQRVVSAPFEPYLDIAPGRVGNELDLLLDDLCVLWLSAFARKRSKAGQQNFIDCMKVILLNLLRAAVRDKIATVGIARGKGQLDAKQRYLPPFMSVSYFLQALEHLTRQGLITCISEGYQNNGLAEVSRYRLSPDSRVRAMLSDLSKNDFRFGVCPETIRLKDQDHRLTKYKDTSETNAMRSVLAQINATLSKADIDLPRHVVTTMAPEDRHKAEAKHLYRVFNNGSFQEGGRFYGPVAV